MNEVYLDNSSTTPPFKEVLDHMYHLQLSCYGNPSSLHYKGIEAEKSMENSRKIIASFLQASPEELIFTSGGTEANNLAIKGLAYRHLRRGTHLITTPIEHPSSLNAFQQLAQEGFRVSYVQLHPDGSVVLPHLLSLIDSQTTLVSIIHVNNEIGTIQDLPKLAEAIKEKSSPPLVHFDGIQSLGKLPLLPHEHKIDALSLSAHKVHGPKGAGALWLKAGTKITPLFQGGDQEQRLRPGTENTPGIAGFGHALYCLNHQYQHQGSRLSRLKHKFWELITSSVEVNLNGPEPSKGAPHILNLSFPGVKAEVLIRSLEQHRIYVSPGSACHSRHPEPSHVLTALGHSRERIDEAVRFSFSVLNTEKEIEYAAEKVATTVKELREFFL